MPAGDQYSPPGITINKFSMVYQLILKSIITLTLNYINTNIFNFDKYFPQRKDENRNIMNCHKIVKYCLKQNLLIQKRLLNNKLI